MTQTHMPIALGGGGAPKGHDLAPGSHSASLHLRVEKFLPTHAYRYLPFRPLFISHTRPVLSSIVATIKEKPDGLLSLKTKGPLQRALVVQGKVPEPM